MATQTNLDSFSSIEKIVSRPTWKEILFDLIHSRGIDPWNIDIVKLADAFAEHVKKMSHIDFGMEANVILAASILLKYKSETLKAFAYPPDPIQETLDGYAEGEVELIPTLALASRIPPKRSITLDELLGEMERVIKYDTTERIKVPKGTISETFDMEVSEQNLETDLTTVYEKAKAAVDTEGWALFSRISANQDVRAIVYTLICLLYLVQRDMVDLRQDEMFGEIFVKILPLPILAN